MLTDLDKNNLGLKNRGYLHERIYMENGDLERAFAEEWEQENKPHRNLLTQLFGGTHWVSVLERYVAATVVQWLGTNCGFAFLLRVLRKCGYSVVPSREYERVPFVPPKPERKEPQSPWGKRKLILSEPEHREDLVLHCR